MIIGGLLALFPCFILVAIFIWLDKYEREDYFGMAMTFLGGIIIAFPAYYFESLEIFASFDTGETVMDTFVMAFLVVAFIEETLKYLVFLLYPWRQPFFNEPYDGILYAVLVGMGFAAAENLVYSYFHGWEVALFRGVTAIPAHLAFSIFMGYYFSKARFADQPAALFLAWLVPFVWHGVYDLFILQSFYEPLALLGVLFIYIWLFRMRKWIVEYQEESPFK